MVNHLPLPYTLKRFKIFKILDVVLSSTCHDPRSIQIIVHMFPPRPTMGGQQQQTLIPLGDVGYMDHTTLFGTIKNQSFRNIIKSKISLDDFLQHPFQSPSLLFPELKIMQSTLLIGASCGLLCTCQNHLN